MLRYYQHEAISLLQSRRSIVSLPRTAGSTTTEAYLSRRAADAGKKVLVAVPGRAPLVETKRIFEAAGVEVGLIHDSEAPRPELPIQLTTVQTFRNRQPPPADLIIIDHCHTQLEGTAELMSAYPNAWFVGFTAYPWKKGLRELWDDLVIPVDTHDLIEEGILSDRQVYEMNVPSRAVLHDEAIDERTYYRTADAWQHVAKKQPAVIFCVNVAHAEAVANLYASMDVKAQAVAGEVPVEEYEALGRRIEAGELEIVTTHMALTRVHLPVRYFIDAAPTGSELVLAERYDAALGGGGETHYLDLVGNIAKLGLPRKRLITSACLGKGPDLVFHQPFPYRCVRCGRGSANESCPSCGGSTVSFKATGEAECLKPEDLTPDPVSAGMVKTTSEKPLRPKVKYEDVPFSPPAGAWGECRHGVFWLNNSIQENWELWVLTGGESLYIKTFQGSDVAQDALRKTIAWADSLDDGQLKQRLVGFGAEVRTYRRRVK